MYAGYRQTISSTMHHTITEIPDRESSRHHPLDAPISNNSAPSLTMSSSLIAALVLSSSLLGPSSHHLGADAFSPIGSASGGSTSSVATPQRDVSNTATTALHLSNQPSGPSAESIVSVYGGSGGGDATNNNDGGNKRRRSGRNGNNKGKRRSNRNQNTRRNSSNNSPSRQSSASPVARSAAETAKSREQHLELRSKLEKMQRRNGQGEELSREFVSLLVVSWNTS